MRFCCSVTSLIVIYHSSRSVTLSLKQSGRAVADCVDSILGSMRFYNKDLLGIETKYFYFASVSAPD